MLFLKETRIFYWGGIQWNWNCVLSAVLLCMMLSWFQSSSVSLQSHLNTRRIPNNFENLIYFLTFQLWPGKSKFFCPAPKALMKNILPNSCWSSQRASILCSVWRSSVSQEKEEIRSVYTVVWSIYGRTYTSNIRVPWPSF